MKSVKLEHVTKTFGNVTAVKDVDVHIKNGVFFTFLCPGGCGKTTTLRMIAGFYLPTNGEEFFNDEDVTAMNPNRRNVEMVFQNYVVFLHMTDFANIDFGF